MKTYFMFLLLFKNRFKKKQMKISLLFFLLLLQMQAGAQKEVSNKLVQNADGKVAQLIDLFNADAESLNKVYLFKENPEYYNRFLMFYSEELQQLKSLSFNALSVSDQVDYLLFKRNLIKAIEDLETSKKEYASIAPLVPFAKQIVDLQILRRRGAALQPETTATLRSGQCAEPICRLFKISKCHR